MNTHPARPAHTLFDFHVRLAPRPEALPRLLAALDAAGSAQAAVCAGGVIALDQLSRQLVEGGHTTADADNDAVLAACRAHPGRLVPFWFGNPHRPAAEYAERAPEFRGLELSPAVHGEPLGSPRSKALIAVAQQHGHCVYTVCLERPGCRVADLTELAARHPETVFVLGHAGVGNIDYYGIALIEPYPNILLETSGGYSTVLRRALGVLGPDRVLFGSEYPLQHPVVELAKFAAAGVSEEEWRLAGRENALRLLGPVPSSPPASRRPALGPAPAGPGRREAGALIDR
ncbi:amidohydrolase family protein [Streptomyces sp. YU58]|uniref:amidohydrolase family protein n=1 Tax=Streptomyces sp. SX92 TaxID=3158972 RepID=UPI0027B984A8|nr:amidohydrolase family protein [Streptomyces coralus]WLW52458.1 amidohydrolase family protein [Streptomyces coralus]